MPDNEITKTDRMEVIPADAVRDLIASAVSEGIAEGVSRALAPVADRLAEMSKEVAASNSEVSRQLGQMADTFAGRESLWDEHDRNAHELDPTLAQRQAEAARNYQQERRSLSG